MVAAWDVETQGLGGKLLSIQWGCLGELHFDSSPNMVHNFITYILEFPSPFVWYAHFSQYDWRYIMDYFHENEMDIEIFMRTDNDIYQITIKHGKKRVVMRDSYAIFNSKLEDMAKSFCPEIPKQKIDIEHYDPQILEHKEYALQDIRILLTALPKIFTLLRQHFDIETGGTFAGNSIKAWQNTMENDELYNASKYDETELFIRQGYYGGLVFLTTTNTQKNAITLDINSSYPDIMCTQGVPYGRRIRSTNYKSGVPGIYRCRVRSPANLRIPIIPARNSSGSMRWYSGEFDTVCTNVELIFAAKHGYEILKIYEGICWEKIVFPFNKHIEHCKDIRKQYKKKPEEILAKYMQNSCYGKFAAKRDRRLISPSYLLTDDQILGTPIFDDITEQKIGRKKDGWIPYDDAGKWYFKKEIDTTMKCLPEWSVFITANARIKLLEVAYRVGIDNVYYGDTDSITMKRGCEKLVDCGDDYGQWKVEKTWKEFRPIAPKIYAGILETGNYVGAAKGLPSPRLSFSESETATDAQKKTILERQWVELLHDGKSSAQALSLDSLRASLKKGVNPATTLIRKSGTVEGSQNYYVDTSGNVHVKIAA